MDWGIVKNNKLQVMKIQVPKWYLNSVFIEKRNGIWTVDLSLVKYHIDKAYDVNISFITNISVKVNTTTNNTNIMQYWIMSL